MVLTAITAVNPEDTFSRTWGLGIDVIPTGNWLKDPSIIKQPAMKSGETWKFDFNLVDGKHTVYFIISQTPGALGTYQGEANFGDKARFTFVGVDNDSVAAFEMNVAGKKFFKVSSGSSDPVQDIPTTSGQFIPNIKGKFSFLRGIPLALKGKGSGQWNAWNAVIVTVVGVGGIVAALGLRKRMKRRF